MVVHPAEGDFEEQKARFIEVMAVILSRHVQGGGQEVDV
jgi:hypothetical protein